MQKFFTGDVVTYIKKSGGWASGTHIIHECYYKGNGKFHYSTNRGAWMEDNDFELVERANKKSFRKLDDCIDF